MRGSTYVALLAVLVPFSLVSVGGGPSIVAALQHQAVDLRHWVNGREFVDLFAIARAAPGPGSMLVTLLGWKVAGWSGALVATLAMFVPSSVVCYAVAGAWNRHRGKGWHSAVERGMVPVVAGLLFAGVLAIGRLADAGIPYWLLAFATLGILTRMPRINVLLLLLGGGLGMAAWRAFWP